MGAVFHGYTLLILYFAVCAMVALVMRRLFRIPDEFFRKTLHFIVLGSVLILVYAINAWWVSAAAATAFAVTVFPILAVAERLPNFSDLLTERKRGEIKRSLIAAFSMFVLLIGICWGWQGERYLVVASVFAWGLGDAAAALVGKSFGRHYLEGRQIEGRKTLEGTIAMFVVSMISVTIVLLASAAVAWQAAIPIAILTAAVCAVVELYTKGGMDTLTCPLAAAAVLIPLIRISERAAW